MNPFAPRDTSQSWDEANQRIDAALNLIEEAVTELGTVYREPGTTITVGDVSNVLSDIVKILNPRIDEPTELGTCIESANGSKAIRVFSASVHPPEGDGEKRLCWYTENGVLLKWTDFTQPVKVIPSHAELENEKLGAMVSTLQAEVQGLSQRVTVAEQNASYSDHSHRSVVARCDMIVKAVNEIDTHLKNGRPAAAANRIVQLRVDMHG